MSPLSLVLTSTIISFIWRSFRHISTRFNKVGAVIKPILDIMQTMPAFVYLIRRFLFGLGNVTALLLLLFSQCRLPFV